MKHHTDTRHALIAELLTGSAVALREDWGFFEKGDRGTIVEYTQDCLCRVKFDGGAEQDFPHSMMEVLPSVAFAYFTHDAGLAPGVWATEEQAADAAHDAGHREYAVLQVHVCAQYAVEDVPSIIHAEPAPARSNSTLH